MVQAQKGGYVCEACHLIYEQKKWAEACERHCLAHHTCNLEIAKHSRKSDSF